MSQWDLMLGVLPSCWLRQWLPETPPPSFRDCYEQGSTVLQARL